MIDLGEWNPNLSLNDLSTNPVLAHFEILNAWYESNDSNYLEGETPIQIIQSISDPECNLSEQRFAMKRWDANSICKSECYTVLHLSVSRFWPKLTNFLFEAGCHINVKSKGGKTSLCLMLLVPKWKDSDCINLIKHLINTKHWDPDSKCDSEDNTVLHLTAFCCRPRVAEFMLSETICNPNTKNTAGEIPLQIFIQTWSDSECISIIKLLITTKKMGPKFKILFMK